MRLVEARIGSVLGSKWRVEALIAEGGMGAVYRASHVRSGKRAAIKVLHLEASADLAERFLREARISAILSDPGVVDVYDDDTTPEGVPYLVMELLEGETLEQLAARSGGTIGWETMARLADAALSTLSGAHQLGIIHRDLKPSNLLLTRTGTVKVLDFGIAALRAAPSDRITSSTSPTMGTIGFMPPEQAVGNWDQVDATSDLWALGATMYVLLSGRHVHESTNLHKELVKALTEPVAPLATVAPEVPASIAAVVDRALAFESRDRFPSAGAMRRALSQAVLRAKGVDVVDPDGPTGVAHAYSHLFDDLGSTIPDTSSHRIEARDPTLQPAAAPAVAEKTQVDKRPGTLGSVEVLGVVEPAKRPRLALLIALAVAGVTVLGLGAGAVMIGRSSQKVDRPAGTQPQDSASGDATKTPEAPAAPPEAPIVVATSSSLASASAPPVVTAPRPPARHERPAAVKPTTAPTVDLDRRK